MKLPEDLQRPGWEKEGHEVTLAHGVRLESFANVRAVAKEGGIHRLTENRLSASSVISSCAV